MSVSDSHGALNILLEGQRFLRERQKVVQQIQSGFGGELTLTGDVDKAEERVRVCLY